MVGGTIDRDGEVKMGDREVHGLRVTCQRDLLGRGPRDSDSRLQRELCPSPVY